MENKKSSDHLFDPKHSSSNSVFEAIVSQPSTGHGKDSGIMGSQGGNPDNKNQKGESSGISGKDSKNSVYLNEPSQPCNLSSSINYGGQENYFPSRTNNSETHQYTFKKDDGEDDLNESNSEVVSRGDWWKGSLYY